MERSTRHRAFSLKLLLLLCVVLPCCQNSCRRVTVRDRDRGTLTLPGKLVSNKAVKAEAGSATPERKESDPHMEIVRVRQGTVESGMITVATKLAPRAVTVVTPPGKRLVLEAADEGEFQLTITGDILSTFPDGEYSVELRTAAAKPIQRKVLVKEPFPGYPQVLVPGNGAVEVLPRATFKWTRATHAAGLSLFVREQGSGKDVATIHLPPSRTSHQFKGPALANGSKYILELEAGSAGASRKSRILRPFTVRP